MTPWSTATIPTYPKQRAWAFSTVKTHAQCPALIRYRKIEGQQEPKSVALLRGLATHEAIESYFGGQRDLDERRVDQRWLPLLNELLAQRNATEVKLAFNDQWQPVEWMAPNVWLRVALDLVVRTPGVTVIYEWKTGKVYADHEQQGRLYALAALLVLPPDEKVSVRIRYLDHYPNKQDLSEFTHADIPALKDEFIKFSHAFLNDEIYPARPNPRCKFCHFRKSNGGPCSFG